MLWAVCVRMTYSNRRLDSGGGVGRVGVAGVACFTSASFGNFMTVFVHNTTPYQVFKKEGTKRSV